MLTICDPSAKNGGKITLPNPSNEVDMNFRDARELALRTAEPGFDMPLRIKDAWEWRLTHEDE